MSVYPVSCICVNKRACLRTLTRYLCNFFILFHAFVFYYFYFNPLATESAFEPRDKHDKFPISYDRVFPYRISRALYRVWYKLLALTLYPPNTSVHTNAGITVQRLDHWMVFTRTRICTPRSIRLTECHAVNRETANLQPRRCWIRIHTPMCHTTYLTFFFVTLFIAPLCPSRVDDAYTYV